MSQESNSIKISETNGEISLGNENAVETIRIWFDCNCPYCRRHWLDNLDDYILRIEAGELRLVMIPVAFLTTYSVEIGSLLFGLVPYGAGLYFDVFRDAIFHGISESEGNDEDAVSAKMGELFTNVIQPYLKGNGLAQDDFAKKMAAVQTDKIKGNTERAVEKGINGVPHIE
jgi:protein-disulfide isomerase